MRKLFKEIDADDSGTISLDELMQGFDDNQQMQNMFSKLDISRNDIGMLFELMDAENEGELSYEHLMENLRMSLLDDTRKSLTMLRLQTAEMAQYCKKMHSHLVVKRAATVQLESPNYRAPVSPRGPEVQHNGASRAVTCCTSSCMDHTSSTASGAVASTTSKESKPSVASEGEYQLLTVPIVTQSMGRSPRGRTGANNVKVTFRADPSGHPAGTSKVGRQAGKECQERQCDVKPFEKEVAALHSSLDNALAGMRDSLARFSFSKSLHFLHEGQGTRYPASTLLAKAADEDVAAGDENQINGQDSSGCHRCDPLSDMPTVSDNEVMRFVQLQDSPMLFNDVPPIPRIAALVDDETLLIAQGQAAGEVSL